jgi:ATP-dependent phosphofructokinase / diphosphate-dependent phosphofructokinase
VVIAKKRVMVVTGGGDCPGLNAVIRAVVKRMDQEPNWEVVGGMEAYNGILRDPKDVMMLDDAKVAGIHSRGGTILKTTNKGGPFEWPVMNPDGTWHTVDRVEDLRERLNSLGIEAIISIGGEGSMDIAHRLQERGINVVGVPKTIDNDLSATDVTFGFQTAVEIATEAVDRLVTTASSHNRVMILEAMGRHAGWIALSAAIAGGADVALIPEIPYDLEQVVCKIKDQTTREGYAIIVIAEGAKPKHGQIVSKKSDEVGYQNVMYGGVGHELKEALKHHIQNDMRVMILGHLQRGGSPCAYDRILSTQFGVKAAEMVLAGQFGMMASFQNNKVVAVPIEEAIKDYNFVKVDSTLVHTARGAGICLGDASFCPLETVALPEVASVSG